MGRLLKGDKRRLFNRECILFASHSSHPGSSLFDTFFFFKVNITQVSIANITCLKIRQTNNGELNQTFQNFKNESQKNNICHYRYITVNNCFCHYQ